jgi:hypothetical protein
VGVTNSSRGVDYALEIPLLRTIFYLFNWVEAGFLNRTLSSRLKPIPYTVGGFGLRMKSGVSLLPFFVFPFLFGGLYLGAQSAASEEGSNSMPNQSNLTCGTLNNYMVGAELAKFNAQSKPIAEHNPSCEY